MGGSQSKLTYLEAGVDLEAKDALVERIAALAKRTHKRGLLSGIGGFAGLFALPLHYREPVLVAGADGVGTKLKIAFAMGIHGTVGIDLVAMNANDIATTGAEPLFFLDYFACGKLKEEIAEAVISGIVRGCEEAGCVLLGGETAEMPGMYKENEYDLAGFALGVVERSAIIDGKRVGVGDCLIGLASSGLHSNGYSLVRKLIETRALSLDSTPPPLDEALGLVLLRPTRIYVRAIRELIQKSIEVRAIAHITGGGIPGNLPRVLPKGIAAKVRLDAWPRPPVFEWLEREGIDPTEMRRTFNLGIGLILVVPEEQKHAAISALIALGESAHLIGHTEACSLDCPDEERVRFI
ncbi:MAG: phosphoribosylformylglycinamidine cyclo-ligase [Sandaracinaceae bacterium]|nr:phosphoribosylformylglycinamidine cyclo-ligase [Sandaracinaceae bacterium]